MTEARSPYARFAGATQSPKPPETFFVLPPRAFSDRWKGKPSTDVAVGLRLVSDADLDVARAEAKKRAWEMHDEPGDSDGRIDCYNETLMQWVVAFAACDVNDRSRSYFDAAPDTVPLAFTSHGLRRAFDEYERFVVEQSVIDPPASDEELRELGARLTGGKLSSLDPTKQLRARKWLRFVLDQMRELEPELDFNAYVQAIPPMPHGVGAPLAAVSASAAESGAEVRTARVAGDFNPPAGSNPTMHRP